ncbi:hypothetical protein HaLaN_05681 [Haematococcus lacustris]|uniref:Uncharacterized protein n=1 Tax=Haematococcus lacustris TaxID=44745 RepID=A0A699YRM1_HAELA|nr:hypothetical protein HaLaN_05681 [Haematococcus lacustris]
MPTASKGLHGLDAHQPLPSVQVASPSLAGQAAELHAAAGRRGLTSWSAVYATKSGGTFFRAILPDLVGPDLWHGCMALNSTLMLSFTVKPIVVETRSAAH